MKILVLGIGNVLFSDEGIGVHLCHYMQKKYNFYSDKNSLDFIDGGTLAHRLIPVMSEYEHIILLDCISADNATIGDVFFFDFDNIPNNISWQGSAHEVEMLQTLNMMDMVGDRPTTKIVGIVPKVISETTLSLSDEVINGSKLIEKIIIKHLKELGFEAHIIDETLTIQDVAYSFSG